MRLLVLLLLLAALKCEAQVKIYVTNFTGKVTLAWDHSKSSEVVGYALYYGTNGSGAYYGFEKVPYTNVWTLTNLPLGRYFFCAKAYAMDGTNEVYSVFSNETNWILAPRAGTNMNAATKVVGRKVAITGP